MFLCMFIVILFACTSCGRDYNDGDVRLIGGQRRYMGTVAIYHEGKWGAVCDGQWDRHDATVVCRQLGYPRAVKAAIRSEFGPGTRRMWLSKVKCKGDELRLSDCPHAGFNITTRDHCTGRLRSAGVICSAVKEPNATKAMKRTNKKLYDKSADAQFLKNFNKVSLRENGRKSEKFSLLKKVENSKRNMSNKFFTTPVPYEKFNFTLEEGSSTTMLTTTVLYETFNSASSESTTQGNTLNHSDTFIYNVLENTTQPIKEIAQDDYESSVNKTLDQNSETNTINTSVEIGNISHTKIQTLQEDTKMLLADAPQEQLSLEVRLQGGRYKWEGHLQVRSVDDQWTTICADFWTMREAMVACKQLKDLGKGKQALLTNYFGGETVNKGFYRIKCTGKESILSECELTKIDSTHVCSKKTSVAGVVCSNYLPDLVTNIRALEDSIRLQDQPLYYLRCSMEENCLSHSAYVIYNTSTAWRSNLRRLLRFSTIVHNRGNADFRPYLPRGQWQWHSCHMHYHSMEVFAHYDIIDQNGTRLAQGSKASFCLEDSACDQGVNPQFNCKGYAEQGLSVNCSDNYLFDIDCQWIDVTDIKAGEYNFLIEINPDLLVAESDFDNNVVHCILHYTGYFASLRNCRYESLLDFRKP